MSFYKEELAGETANMISFFAASRGLSKMQAVWKVADETAEAVQRATRVLSLNKDAYDAWMAFRGHYVGFHAGLPRYKLREIGL